MELGVRELLEGDVERVGIGPWTAKSAAEVLLTQRWGGVLTQRGKRAEGQRSKNFTIAVMGVIGLSEKLGEKAREFCGCRGRNGIILRKD